ncbi:DUF2079 domain-containing protein [bacterium]|nr:DUF2079 domain-containing protein [bacterium]
MSGAGEQNTAPARESAVPETADGRAAHFLALAVLATAFVLAATALGYLAVARYRGLETLWPKDFAIYTQVLHNAREGRGFTHTLISEGSIFRFRSVYILHLHRALLEFASGPLPAAMVRLQAFLVLAGVFAFYALAARVLRSAVMALLVALAFLADPLLHAIVLCDFRLQPLLIALLPILFLAQHARRPVLFAVAAFFTLSVKDHAFVYLLVLALYEFAHERDRRWIAADLGAAALYGLWQALVVPGSLVANIAYGSGTAPLAGAMGAGLLPAQLSAMATQLGLPFVVALFAPFELLGALPSIVKSVLTVWTGPNDMYVYYWSEALAFTFIALPFALKRLGDAVAEARGARDARLLVYALLGGMIAVQAAMIPSNLARWRAEFAPDAADEAAWRLAEIVPRDAPAAADRRNLMALAERKTLYELDDPDRGPLWDEDGTYLLFREEADGTSPVGAWRENPDFVLVSEEAIEGLAPEASEAANGERPGPPARLVLVKKKGRPQ